MAYSMDTGPNDAARAEIGLCLLVAVADGAVSEVEIGALSTRLGALLGDEYPALGVAELAISELARMGDLGPERYVESLASRVAEHRRRPALEAALAVAIADGLADEEEQMVRDVGAALGIAKDEVDALLTRYRTSS